MDPRFAVHNAHREAPSRFAELDPHLRRLRGLPLVHENALLDRLPRDEPGIYTLGGARQVGKTTLVKQWMARLLARGVPPGKIAFLTGELVDDHHALVRHLGEELDAMGPAGVAYVCIDEVSYIREWDRGIKFLADAGRLERAVLLFTGSDLALVHEARARLPGRRGRASEIDFHLWPLSFLEATRLAARVSPRALDVLEGDDAATLAALDGGAWDAVDAALTTYLVHGGFLPAMNDIAAHGRIVPATLATYADWIRGDFMKRGKQETYLREVLGALVARLGSHLTWNGLASELSIDHPATVADYVHLLAAMDAVFVQPALVEDKLTAAPKKARKVWPADPFVLHAVRHWLVSTPEPLVDAIQPWLVDPRHAAALVEGLAATHARRHWPTYYMKAAGEVDVVIVRGRRFWPIEVKWTGQLRPKDLRQVRKYRNGAIATRTRSLRWLDGLPVLPIPYVLALLGQGRWPPRLPPPPAS